MAILPRRTLGDPVLRAPAADVEAFDSTLRRLEEDMFETMYDAPGVGLAAPQVGLSLRFFVFDDGSGAKGAVANPRLTDLEGEQIEDEGCLSIPGLYYETPRANRVKLQGQDHDGRPIDLDAESLLARIFQHETDHLAGLLFIDRLAEPDRRRALGMLRESELGDPLGRVSRSSRRP